ncbi:uncharacterized protein BDR25DRAFT_395909 [Lindgomyces ingoldianus]|uniref:Uncharacterized protein n=1 Tax=Lindgomyces ingoldianus TaxID=673940 RepID=A0ACB6QIY9_9PLEO|nr:uncharacterized protein BDR25DRAFT_395909 [Lindgomyces ingoldianus]KAF2466087.1 hypothetical protein BDR25DRAFT_395909 [Lindgomyces ingoldianus]
MNLPQIRASIISPTAESHVALAGFHIDFSLIKVQAPSEYRDIGRLLSPRRKTEADEGQSHLTAAQLGLLFEGLVPKVPDLIRAYGLRCSEVAKSPTFNPKGTAQHGLFANEVGADGTAIWAAATSSPSAIAVHLLACMLSRMWDPPAAISIWMQLIAERKQAMATSGNPVEYAISSNICLTREQVASWHTSAHAWRLTADQANARRHHQFLVITKNLGIPVNNKLHVSDSVLDAWRTSMVTVDKLIAGHPQSIQTGAPLVGLASWHLYPNMVVFGQGKEPKPTEIFQNDLLVQPSGIITLGIQDTRRSGDGIYWSLPLAHLRYYGQPIQTEAQLSLQTARGSIDDLVHVALGSLIRRWCASEDDIELALKLLVRLDGFLDIPEHMGGEGTWLSLMASEAKSFLDASLNIKAEILQLIKCGRRRFPTFIDDPRTDAIFGLSHPSVFLKLLPGNAARVNFLRKVAEDFSDRRFLMIIQCRSGDSNSKWELSSVERLRSRTKRIWEDESSSVGADAPRRYFRWLSKFHVDYSHFEHQPDSDSIRLDVPIPSFWAPHGSHWQHAPRSFYGKILEEECADIGWQDAKDASVQSLLAFGDPDVAALYCINIRYWTSISPNDRPQVVSRSQYRPLPNICILRHILWALEEKLPSKAALPSREALYAHLSEGRYTTNDLLDEDERPVLTALRGLVTVSKLYKGLTNATVDLRVADRPLSKHQWIPRGSQSLRTEPFGTYPLTREQSLACIARFESGNFNFHPSAMNGVLAISSGNSIYVARCLLEDPCAHRASRAIERVVGNLGKTGMVMLVSPEVPQVRPISDNVRLVNHHPFDGNEEDCFGSTTLHLSFTEWQLPMDVGSRGNRDVEAYYLEAAVGVYDRGKWVADLNILDVFKHRFSRIMPMCTKRHENPLPREELCKLVSIDSWEELLDGPPEVSVVRARGNWQARLAAAALSIQQGHETRIMTPDQTCWTCCLSLKSIPQVDKREANETSAHDDDIIEVPADAFDEEPSDSETDEVVQASFRRHENRNKGADDRSSGDGLELHYQYNSAPLSDFRGLRSMVHKGTVVLGYQKAAGSISNYIEESQSLPIVPEHYLYARHEVSPQTLKVGEKPFENWYRNLFENAEKQGDENVQPRLNPLLLGTKCPHLRPNSGRRYSHVDSVKSYSAQPRLNTLTIAPPQLTLTHSHLKLNHGRSRSNLAALGCLCCRSVSHSRSRFWAPRSQFRDPLYRAARGDLPPGGWIICIRVSSPLPFPLESLVDAVFQYQTGLLILCSYRADSCLSEQSGPHVMPTFSRLPKSSRGPSVSSAKAMPRLILGWSKVPTAHLTAKERARVSKFFFFISLVIFFNSSASLGTDNSRRPLVARPCSWPLKLSLNSSSTDRAVLRPYLDRPLTARPCRYGSKLIELCLKPLWTDLSIPSSRTQFPPGANRVGGNDKTDDLNPETANLKTNSRGTVVL